MSKFYVPPSLATSRWSKSSSKTSNKPKAPTSRQQPSAYGARQDWQALAKAVKKRDGYACAKCGQRYAERQLEAHHIVPLSRGGSNSMANLVTLCHDHHMALHSYMDSVVSSRARRNKRSNSVR